MFDLNNVRTKKSALHLHTQPTNIDVCECGFSTMSKGNLQATHWNKNLNKMIYCIFRCLFPAIVKTNSRQSVKIQRHLKMLTISMMICVHSFIFEWFYGSLFISSAAREREIEKERIYAFRSLRVSYWTICVSLNISLSLCVSFALIPILYSHSFSLASLLLWSSICIKNRFI